jgi:hypothetical protein
MTCIEHYFENLLYDGKDNLNKEQLSPEVQEAVKECATYVLTDIFNSRQELCNHTGIKYIGREEIE